MKVFCNLLKRFIYSFEGATGSLTDALTKILGCPCVNGYLAGMKLIREDFLLSIKVFTIFHKYTEMYQVMRMIDRKWFDY